MKNENNPQTRLSDFYLACFLRAKGFRLLGVEKSKLDPQRVIFIFENKKNQEKIVEDFLFGRAQIEPKSFISAIKELKQLIHSIYD